MPTQVSYSGAFYGEKALAEAKADRIRRRRQVVDYYAAGNSLRKTAKHFDVCMQRVHQIISEEAPNLMRPPHTNMPPFG